MYLVTQPLKTAATRVLAARVRCLKQSNLTKYFYAVNMRSCLLRSMML